LQTNFTKSFKSSLELLPEMETFILEKFHEFDIPKDIKDNLEIAVAEAAANSILHGNKSDPSKNVDVKISLTSSNLIISFKDEGVGFNPNNVPDPTVPENIQKSSGRGLHIMKSLVDDVKYNFTESGTELILIFKIG